VNDGWLRRKTAASYCGVSLRTVDTWLRQGLRHVKMPSGVVLIKRKWADQYIEQHENTKNEIEKIVNEIGKEIKLG